MSKRIQIADVKDDEDKDLRILLEKYIRRSEELERRESKVMKQIELMQSAVSSLQDWNRNRKESAASSPSSSEPVHVNLKEIEEETKLIKEETKKIQREVQQKIQENKMLEEEVNRRKRQQSGTFVFFAQNSTKEADVEIRETEESASTNPDSLPGIEFFNEKLRKLKEMERKLQKESELQSEEARKKTRILKEKLEMLEWESQIDRQLLQTFAKKSQEK